MTRSGLLFRTVGAAALVVLSGGAAQAQQQSIQEALWGGAYEDAIERLQESVDREPTPANVALLTRTFMEVGLYDQALETVEDAPAAMAAHLANVRGEVLWTVGRLDEAAAAWDEAMAANVPERHVARLNRAVHEYTYGSREAALAEFDRFIDLYNRAEQLPARDLMAVGTAVKYLGVTNSELIEDAMMAFEEAIRLAGNAPAPRLALAELMLEHHNPPEAHALINEVLSRNDGNARALLAKAEVLKGDGEPGVMGWVDRALAANPNMVEALVFKAEQLMAAEAFDDAKVEIDRALEINPNSLEALTALAAHHYLQGAWNAYTGVRDQALALAPEYPELFNDIAELAGNSRKYAQAADLARQALEMDPRSARAHTLLGMNQLRLGQIEEGKANLERAIETDPRDVRVHNTLILVDSFDRYDVFETERFVFMLEESESELLLPYIEEVAEDAYEFMAERYGYEPPLPIRIEVYPEDSDFSVRTVGLTGIGALGVAFGSVIAMDSPAAKQLGTFNWASTLWHEMAHVFHLGMTEHQVPRWFSEGLAVHEQHAAGRGWGHQPSPGFISRYNQDLFLPASRLNAGFVRPSYPQQVVDSYFLASIVFEFIEGRWGFEAITDMLNGFADGKDTVEQIEGRLGLSADDFDEAFDDYFRTKYAAAIASIGSLEEGVAAPEPTSMAVLAAQEPNSFETQLRAGIEAFEAQDWDTSLRYLERARELFPEYGGADSPHWFIARVHEERGNLEEAVASLATQNAINESDYRARMKEAELRETLGDQAGAAAALESAAFIYPYEFELHERIAAAQTELGRFDAVVRERRAILALDPVDRADAYYQLAVAQKADGDLENARRSVMRALEIAPSFDPALDLLLELRGGTERRP